MPEISLEGGPDDPGRVMATMLFPSNEKLCEQCFTVHRVRRELLDAKDSNVFTVSANTLKLLELAGLATGEGLIYAIRDKSEKRDKEGNLVDPGVSDKRLIVIDTEFASTLVKSQRKDSILSPVLRKCFDGARLDNPTRGEPYLASRPHVCIIGHITPRELVERLTLGECSNGFANRFLPIYSRRPKLGRYPNRLHSRSAGHLPS